MMDDCFQVLANSKTSGRYFIGRQHSGRWWPSIQQCSIRRATTVHASSFKGLHKIYNALIGSPTKARHRNKNKKSTVSDRSDLANPGDRAYMLHESGQIYSIQSSKNIKDMLLLSSRRIMANSLLPVAQSWSPGRTAKPFRRTPASGALLPSLFSSV